MLKGMGVFIQRRLFGLGAPVASIELSEGELLEMLARVRDHTTYLWPGLVEVARSEQTDFACQIRQNSFAKVSRELELMQESGHLRFVVSRAFVLRREGDEVLNLSLFGISHTLKGLIQEIVRRTHGPPAVD